MDGRIEREGGTLKTVHQNPRCIKNILQESTSSPPPRPAQAGASTPSSGDECQCLGLEEGHRIRTRTKVHGTL